jgi:hypothetical protein
MDRRVRAFVANFRRRPFFVLQVVKRQPVLKPVIGCPRQTFVPADHERASPLDATGSHRATEDRQPGFHFQGCAPDDVERGETKHVLKRLGRGDEVGPIFVKKRAVLAHVEEQGCPVLMGAHCFYDQKTVLLEQLSAGKECLERREDVVQDPSQDHEIETMRPELFDEIIEMRVWVVCDLSLQSRFF